MLSRPKLKDEAGRIAALNRYQVLDTPAERPFENVVTMVEEILGVPICAVSLVDVDRQWFKASRGLGVCETGRDVAFCDHAIRQLEPLIVRNALEDDRFKDNPLVTGAPHIRAYAGVPLRSPEGFQVGTLCAIDTQPRSFPDHEIKVLQSFARLVVDELELRVKASSDVLTGTLTRRAWMATAEEEIRRADRNGAALCVSLLDIDRFKAVNDTWGHATGDQVIKAVVSACSQVMRAGQKVGRLGGEEFALLLPECDLDQAVRVAERCRRAIEALKVPTSRREVITPTASFGVAQCGPYAKSPDALVEAADEALYRAKETGRNRVVRGSARPGDLAETA